LNPSNKLPIMKTTFNFLIIFTLMLLSNIIYSQSVPSYVPTSGLVGWWGFNGNAQDGSGNGNHGTVNGATLTTDRFGNQNGAFAFNGTSSFIGLVSPFFGGSTTVPSFTYLAEFKVNSVPPSGAAYAISNKEGFWRTLGLFIQENGSVSFGGSQPNPQSYIGVVSPSNTISPNQWYSVILTFENSLLSLYVNNVLVATSVINYTSLDFSWLAMGNSTSTNYFGAAHPVSPGITHFFNGILDDFGIWNRALTQQEITNLYNSQLPTQTSLCLPTITTSSTSSVGVDSAVIGGNITNDGGSSIVLRGVCYSTTPNPNMGNQRTEDGSGIGSFNTVLRGLTSSTMYYARSYAKNSNGVVVYGNEVSFTTSSSLPGVRCPGTSTVTDIDGNVYNTVQIGNQCWTQSNLKTSRYRNGDSIPTGLSNSAWENTTSGAYAIYDNDPVNDGLYGKLYNHYAVTDSRGLCPTGWHVPSDAEWNMLQNNLTSQSITGGGLKSTVTQPTIGGWALPNVGATNSLGYSALPGGRRWPNGSFGFIYLHGIWWTSTIFSLSTAPDRHLNSYNSNVDSHNNNRAHGYSIRCLKD
jgi:uncharacterized protein (TIGR02145 family)